MAKRAPNNEILLGPPRSDRELRRVLERFVAGADPQALARGDPIELVQSYPRAHDREVAGLLVASVAYGRVAAIKTSARALLEMLGPSPAKAIESARIRNKARGFVYRFQRGDDFPRFLEAIARVRKRHGSLAALFRSLIELDEPDYAGAMDRFALALRAEIRGEPSRGLLFLIPRADPAGGSAKRLCLYLRWMIRSEAPDLGAWSELEPGVFSAARLLIPLDTHIERIGRYIGLTERKSAGLRVAQEITASLRRLHPEDPLRYDMALCHLGISGACPRTRHVDKCRDCPIRGVCRLGKAPAGWA